MASNADGQEPGIPDASSALDGVPTPFLEAGIQLSLETLARRRGVPKAVVLEEIIARIDEPFHSAALDALLGRGKRLV